MKINGKRLSPPKPAVIIIPREDEELVFYAAPIIDTKEFDKLCPEPSPTRVIKPGGAETFDNNDPAYLESVNKHNERRFAWMIIQSLLATEGLEFEKVKVNDPATWLFYEEELEESGLTKSEINYLTREVVNSNIIDDAKVKEARERFFKKQQTPAK